MIDTAIKDTALAQEVAEIEKGGAPPAKARGRIREAIESRYTLPA